MTKNELVTAFEKTTPTTVQKSSMRQTILSPTVKRNINLKSFKFTGRRGFRAMAASLALVLMLAFLLQPSKETVAYAFAVTRPDGNTVLMEDRNAANAATEVSYVDNGPQLRFFISGQDIAEIEITAQNEFVSAQDFTETLAEEYWNPELYYEETEIDGITYQYVPAKSGFKKSLVIKFPENFQDYDQVWYDWYGWNIRDWAGADEDSRIQGYSGLDKDQLDALLQFASPEEKLAIAAGGGATSAAGHILLAGYPENLLKDRIMITITDRQGKCVTKTLTVTVSNNTLGQTVVSAKIIAPA